MAEEIIFYRDDLPLQLGEVRPGLLQQSPQERGGGGAGGDGEGGRRGVWLLQTHGGEEILLQRAQHPHAVLQLAVALVVVLLRQGQPRPEVQLIGAEKAPCAEAPQVLLPELLGNGDDVPRVLGADGAQLGKTLPVLGDAHRHQRAAGELPLRQVAEGAAQLVAVVPAGADDDLPVHDDTRLAERLNIVQRPLGILVAQHGAVELGVGGVDGDVDGADVQIGDALGLPLRQVRQGDVVAQQEAEPRIVVLEVQGRAHSRRHLIHKAENAVIGAAAHLVHQIGVEIQTQILSLRLADGDGTHVARCCFQLHAGQGVIAVKAVIQYVHNGVAVDRQKLFAHLYTGFFRRAVPVNGGDDGAHSCILSHKRAYAHIITILL